MSRLPILVLMLVACARRPEEIAADSGRDVRGLVAEASPQRVVLLTEDRKLLTIDQGNETEVFYQDHALPGIGALMEGDRVRASFDGGSAESIEIDQSTNFHNQRTVRRVVDAGERLPKWSDTMRSPGGGIGSSRWIGTWNYTPPVWREGPPPKNPVTGKPTPADQRPSF